MNIFQILDKKILPISVLIFSLPSLIFSLEIPPELRKKFSSEFPKQSMQTINDQEQFENSLDSNRYIVGGGDRFQISIIDLPSQEFYPVVDASGNIFDRELGLISVGKVSLASAKSIITERIKKNLRKNYSVYVSLNHIKNVTLTITGLSNGSGTVTVPGNVHILDAIKKANNDQIPNLENFDLRHVKVINGDSIKKYDLIRFLNKNDVNENPYVYPGDLISLDLVDTKVFVTGQIRGIAKGWIPIQRGENAGFLLDLLNFNDNADSTTIFIQQPSSSENSPLKALRIEDAKKILLANNDFIIIGTKVILLHGDTINITGEVNRPGTYPISKGQESIKTLLDLAGGPTTIGNLENAFILRHHKKEEITKKQQLDENLKSLSSTSKPNALNLQAVRPEVASSITDLMNSGDYILVKSFNKMDSIKFENGDEIHIPRSDSNIYVSGNVREPGAYKFKTGADFQYYINLAKGYTQKADVKNKYLLVSYNGITQIKDVRDLSAGDIIVVPAAIEYKRFTSVYLPLISILPGILSLFLTVYVLNQK